MAEEQTRMKWKEYLEDRLEARLLQESLKMEERLRQERMLILELVEQKIKRAMRKFRMEEMNAIIEEAMEEEREEREARKWLQEQLEEGVKAKDWDFEVETRNVKRKQRGEGIQQVMWRREEGMVQESRRKKNNGRGMRISVREALAKMLETTPAKEKKMKDRRKEERAELERVDEMMEEEMEANGPEKSG
ncbi:trichohyalin-like [Scleropages formosus]|uniref:trichohyalin-like n=1 Tax=Scleropages formosus TaxID=113540 RepID=UPI0008786D5E|nr:trichohyalin-like [Scleropages formosus]